MSDHQPAPSSRDPDDGAAMPADEAGASQDAPADLLEPDFSRLRLAAASLDAAFPQR